MKTSQNTTLVPRDADNIRINSSLPVRARVADYIRQVGNPYHYNYNGTTVTIKFAGKTKIEDCLAVLVNSQIPVATESPVISIRTTKATKKETKLIPAA